MKPAGTPQSEYPDATKPAGPSPLAAALRWLSRRKLFISYRVRDTSALLSRTLNSLKLRGIGPTLRIAALRTFPPRRQPYTLCLYKDIGNRPEVQLPAPSAAPSASIIIPVHDQIDFTLRCLHSLAASGDGTNFEVIVVDDASKDESAGLLPGIAHLRYHRNETNLGFIGSCNAGFALARGDFVVFLNNDTLVQPGWLDCLLQTFADHPDTGLAGAKLVYPDGRLQEAGGIIYRDGRPANYGRNGDPTDPLYNFVREVDYCSGAALAVPRTLFERLGGFDAHFGPAYFEDTDLAMRVREAGFRVRYQPASVVVHFEGATAGTDVRHGVKSYQTGNQLKFNERWASQLVAGHPDRDHADLLGTAQMLAATHRASRCVLVIDSYTPTPDRDSGSVRMVELMKLMLEDHGSVVFFCQTQTHDGPYTRALQQLGVEVWWRPWISSLPDWLTRHGDRFDAIVGSRHYVLSPVLPILRELAPRAEIVFDTVDLHFLREQREAGQNGSAAAAAAAQRTMASEIGLVRLVDRTWVVSEYERTLLAGISPGTSVEVVSNIHCALADPPGFAARSDIIFVGSFRHPPNVDAASWLVQDIWPAVSARLPGVRLRLVGADAPAQLQAYGGRPGVDFLGHVADLESLLDASRLSVAPLRYGAGIKGKINQSLARGLPVVGTRCAVEGMHLVDGLDVLSAEDSQSFAEAIVRLYQDEELWHRLQSAGLDNTRAHFSPATARRVIKPWMESLRHTTPSA